MGAGRGFVSFAVDRCLKTAINERRLIEFSYSSSTRVAEPHDYGFLNGAAKVLAYQIRSERSPVPGWRLFEVLKMEDVLLLEDSFSGTRRDAHSHHYEWETLIARVE